MQKVGDVVGRVSSNGTGVCLRDVRRTILTEKVLEEESLAKF